ncbi:MAG: hypothetical protein K2I30_02050 [Clostridia bacterium]|nr:hypothetical protein [Clostridia bacterium]
MKKYLGKIVAGVSILLAVLAIIMLVAPGMSPKGLAAELGGESVSLSKIVFGSDKEGFALSIGLLVAFILVIAGIACSVVALLGKGGKIVPVVGAVLLLVGGILFFCTMQLYALDVPEGTPDALVDTAKEMIKETFKLGAGAIMAGIFSVLSGVACAATILVNKD